MSKEDSPYVVGDRWLDKRRDGKAPDVWQIASYRPRTRSVLYRSTGTGDLNAAKDVIHAHVQAERARGRQSVDSAEVLPHLFLYWREHGSGTLSPDVIAGSLRAFIGFLQQDELGVHATFETLNRAAFRRFAAWRKAPHRYEVAWEGRTIATSSKGVKGESVQRNLDDIRAALNHAVTQERVATAPKVLNVPKADRSPPRDVRMPIGTLGAMIGYASAVAETGREDRGFGRWLWLMMGTACRPEAALAFDPSRQWDGALADLHPPDRPRTKKHNPVIPAYGMLARMLDAWKRETASSGLGHSPPTSRRTAWRTMRRALRLPDAYVPKTIRHTVATELRRRGVPAEQLSVLLGHRPADLEPMTAVYAKYDPAYLREAGTVIDGLLGEVNAAAHEWKRTHRLVKIGNEPIQVTASAITPADRGPAR